MTLAKAAMVGAVLLSASAEAFVPQLRAAPLATPVARATCRSVKGQGLVATRMGYLDDLDPQGNNQQGLDGSGKQVMATPDYAGFIDSDGFDGGDGQVGVVGDGESAMEKFDTREIIDNTVGGRGQVSGATKTNRIDKRWNAWGDDSGADEDIKEVLRQDGVEQIDAFTGEDNRKVQRQQYANWFNQQKQWQAERELRDQMEAMNNMKRQKGTDDYKAHLQSGAKANELTDKELENVIFATGAKGYDNTEILKKDDWEYVNAGSRIDGEFEIKGNGMVTINLEPNSMVAEQFICRFTPDTPEEFLVAATAYDLGGREERGQLPRRGTAKDFTVRFNPTGPIAQPLVATLVIDAEDGYKWTYKIIGST